MKTQLPNSITSVQDAEKLLTELFENNEQFHPEDDATQEGIFTLEEGIMLNQLMKEIYDLPGDFDPCAFLLKLFQKDVE